MVAVAEIASGHVSSPGGSGVALGCQQRPTRSRTRLSALSLAVASCWGVMLPQAFANPTGGVVVAGQASMVTTGNNLLVTTQNAAGTNHSAINWQSFSIPQGNTTYFQQPNAASTSINRVVTNTPSQLFGTLGSNGNLVLVNQAGITVGTGAVVDTAGFTASALRMSDADALAGRLRFGDGAAAAGGVSVQGSVLARSGDVVLLGANVDTGTQALVQSPNGSTILAAGQQIELTGRGLEGISMLVQAPSDAAVNLGILKGSAVGVFAGTLRHSGAIDATTATLEGGKVVLKASGDAYVDGSGQILAAGTTGGSVDVLGNRVAITDQASIDVSGQRGGGSIRIGGDYQGKNTEIANASKTYLGSEVVLKADAAQTGNGGRVIVWADDQTKAYGSISAKGGALSGNGGFVEVSGKQNLVFDARVNLLAASGAMGTLLLDPDQIDVQTSGTATIGDVNLFGVNPGTTQTISPATLNAVGGNVVLQATQEINFNDPVNLTTANASLTAQAGGVITVNGAITTNGGNVELTTTATGSNGGAVYVSQPINTGGGNVTLHSDGSDVGGNSIYISAVVNAGTGTVALEAPTSRIEQVSDAITAGGLTASADQLIDLSRTGNSISGNVNLVANAAPSGGSVIFHNSAANATITAAVGGGNVTLLSSGGLTISGSSAVLSTTGDVAISTYGALALSGGITAGGSLSLTTTNQPITQTSDSISVAGPSTVNAGTGNITLQQSGNQFQGAVSLTGGAVKVRSSTDLIVNTLVSTANSAVVLDAGANLSLPSTAIDTGSANLSLASGGLGSITTPVAGLSGANVTLSASNGMIVVSGPVSAAGTISLSSPNASVMDDSGAGLLTANSLSIVAGGQVSFTNPANQVSSVSMDKPGGNTNQFSYMNAGALSLGPITNGGGANFGDVYITSLSGGITQTGPLKSAYANIDSGAGNVTLTNSGNRFGGLDVASSGVVHIVNDATPLTLYDVSSSSLKVSTSGTLGVSGTLSASAAGDAVVLSAGGMLSAGYGGSVSMSGGGRWLAYLPSALDCSCSHYLPSGAQFVQYNYVDPGSTPVLGSGNGALFTNTNAAVLTGSLTGSVSKIYDGSTSISLSGASFSGTSGAGFQDLFMPTTAPFSVSVSGSGTLSTANVGSGIVVSAVAGTTVGGIAGTSSYYGPVVAYGYQLNSGTYGAIGEVTPARAIASINLSGTRVYDGTNIVNASIFSLSGLVGSETLTLSGSGTLADKNVGVNKPVSLGSLALGDGSGLASNYTFAGGTAVATITPATITGISGLVITNKVYDGLTTAGSVSSSGTTSYVGKVANDVLTVVSASGAFSNKNVGTGKLVTVSGVVLGGADAGNYVVDATSIAGSADITQKVIDVSGLGAANKVYDGSNVAVATGVGLGGVVTGDNFSLAIASSTFDNKNAGLAKQVTFSGIQLSGGDAGNYSLSSNSATAVADITPRPLTVTGIQALNKVYDGKTDAAVNLNSVVLNALPNDSVTVASVSGSFADKNVDAGKTVSFSSLILSGPDAGNYTAGNLGQASADITVRPLSTWTGGSGLWSDPNHWDALPDGRNVLGVSIPAGSGAVTFDGAGSPVFLTSLNSSSNIIVAGNGLQVSSFSSTGFSQTGGSLSGSGAFNVNGSFNQTAGSLTFGSVSVVQTAGDLNVSNITAPTVSLTATGGAIREAGALVTGALTTSSTAGTFLNNSGNRIASFQASNNGTGNIELVNTGVLPIIRITNTGGSIIVSNTGGVITDQPVVAPNGSVSLTANSPLTIGAGGVQAGGNVSLVATNLTSAGNITLDGPIESTSGAVAVSAASNLTQNASILAPLGVSASAGGTLTVGPQATTGNQPVSYTVNNTPVSPPRPPASNTTATDQIVSLMQSSPDLSSSRDAAPIDTLLSKDKERDLSKELIVSEGPVCRP